MRLTSNSFLFSDTCASLAHGLSTCLRFFNENCDPHLFKEGKPAFTAATIGMALSYYLTIIELIIL